jgi:ankyrin repeat protein
MFRRVLLGLFLLLAMADLYAMFFGTSMLMRTIAEVSREGSHDALIGIIVFGGIGQCVMVVLLLATIGMVFSKTIPLWGRLSAIAVILLGFSANLAALIYAFGEPDRHKQRFTDKEPIYTSGLHAALEKGDIARVKAILDRDPQSTPELLHASDYQTLEPLHIAVQRSDRPMVEFLLTYETEDDDYGGIVNSACGQHRSPLHYAAIAGNIEIVKLLLNHGAKINAEDFERKTPLVYAREAGNQEIVNLLVQRGGALVDYERLAIEAIEKGDKTVVEKLLAQKVVDPKGRGARMLHCAARVGNLGIAELLLAQGAEVDGMGGNGTPLHDAANCGQSEMIRLLVARGADPNAKNRWNIRPLGWAVLQGKTEAVRVLLELGADPNTAALTDGTSCLVCAQKSGNADVIRLLREHGARQ